MNTLQMIEKINKGQKAFSDVYGTELEVENQMGSIIIVKYGDENHKTVGEAIALTSTVLGLNWMLEDKEISFREALGCVMDGKQVKCVFIDEYNNEDVEYYEGIFEAVYFNEIINGKWYLVNE